MQVAAIGGQEGKADGGGFVNELQGGLLGKGQAGQ